jgi:hypothetical protein
MRHYALLIGLLLTSGSTFVLHLAVDSGGFARLYGEPEITAPAPSDVWYGGVLPPITIEAHRGISPAMQAWVRLIEGSKREASSTLANQHKAASAMRERRRPAGVAL